MSWAPGLVEAPATSSTRNSPDAPVVTATLLSGCAEATPGTASAAPAARVTAAARTARRGGGGGGGGAGAAGGEGAEDGAHRGSLSLTLPAHRGRRGSVASSYGQGRAR